MRLILTATVLTALLTPAMVLAEDSCADIVAATVAEMRAGAAAWDEDMETLARSAAGSACIKALSGVYGNAAAGTAGKNETTVPEAQTSGTTALAQNPADDVQAAAEGDGSAGWKFLGFEVNTVTGSPGQKPYERKR